MKTPSKIILAVIIVVVIYMALTVLRLILPPVAALTRFLDPLFTPAEATMFQLVQYHPDATVLGLGGTAAVSMGGKWLYEVAKKGQKAGEEKLKTAWNDANAKIQSTAASAKQTITSSIEASEQKVTSLMEGKVGLVTDRVSQVEEQLKAQSDKLSSLTDLVNVKDTKIKQLTNLGEAKDTAISELESRLKQLQPGNTN